MFSKPNPLADSEPGRPVPGRYRFLTVVSIGFSALLVALAVALIFVRTRLEERKHRILQVAERQQIRLYVHAEIPWQRKYGPYLDRFPRWVPEFVEAFCSEIPSITVYELEADLPPQFFQDLAPYDSIHSIRWLTPRHSAEVAKLVGRQRNLDRLALTVRNLRDHDLASIAHQQNLQSLFINGLESSKLTGEFLRISPGQLPNLTQLTLTDVNLSADGCACLTQLTSLRSLDLGGCQLTSESAKSLAKLSELVHLFVDERAVDDQFGATLEQLTKLEMLNVKGTSLGALGLEALEHSAMLKQLDTGGIPGTPALLNRLRHCVRLKSADIVWSGNYSASEISTFNALPDLTYLYFAGIGDDEAQHLRQCEHLSGLDINSNRLTLDGVRSLMALPELHHLKLAGSNWGPELVDVLYESPTLETVKVLDRYWEWWELEDLREKLRSQAK